MRVIPVKTMINFNSKIVVLVNVFIWIFETRSDDMRFNRLTIPLIITHLTGGPIEHDGLSPIVTAYSRTST